MFSPYPRYGLVPPTPKPRKRLAFTLLGALFLAQLQIAVTPLPALSQEASGIIIQEVAWAGSSLSNADEWIEFANLNDATTTIGGWSLHGAASNDRTISLPDNAEIPPFGTYVVANYAEDHEKSALMGPIRLTTSTLSISNSTLAIELRDASGLAVDRAGDGTEPFAGSSATNTSMIRTTASNGDRAESWTSATSSSGFKPDLPDMGTPGFCDLCVIPDEPVTEEPIESETEETATSTEGIIDEPVPTSTEDIVEPVEESTPTSTDPVIIEDDPTPTSTAVEPEQTEQESEETNANTQASETIQQNNNSTIPAVDEAAEQPTAQPPIIFRLNETVSNPMSGPEWIEIYVEDSNVTQTDRELELHDATGKLATISEGTPLTAPNFLIIVLSSAKLNNGGDELSLRDTNGIVIDQTEIPKIYKGESWAKDPADGAWKIAETLTPGAQNLFPTIVVELVPESEEMNVDTQTPETIQQFNNETISAVGGTTAQPNTQTTDHPSTQSPDFTDQINQVFTAALASNQTSQPANKTTKTKTTSKGTNSSDLTPYPFDSMFDPTLNEARVRVTGIVASIPKLLGASHNFILQNDDGRGLIVYLPKHLNVPSLGSTVQVGGTLSATYKGPELRMKKTDIWMTTATTTPPTPRLVNLLAPSAEDAWSLVTIEGTVREVKSKSFVLETDDGIEVPVNVPFAVGYNAKRLAKEDRVRVTGLLDLRKDVPSLLPRTAEEIELLKHAEDTLAAAGTAPNRHFPDWVPFAAAGGAIALTGASKRARELIRKRKLQLLMKKAEAVS